MKIQFESGDVVQVAGRSAFRGRITSVGEQYVTVKEDSARGYEQIVRIADIYEFISDKHGSPSLDLMAQPTPQKEDKKVTHRFRAHYTDAENGQYRYLRLEKPDYRRATSYFAGLEEHEATLKGYSLRAIELIDEETGKR